MNWTFARRLALFSVLLACILGSTAAVSEGRNRTVKGGAGAQEKQASNRSAAPVLLQKESLDVDDDGKVDTVAYFDNNNAEIVDGEAIDLGSDGKVDVLAVRCDADRDGKSDDWLVVDAESEEIRAAMIDANDDGEVESVLYADGRRDSLPAGAGGEIQAAFRY